MAEPTAAELKAQLADLQKKAADAQAAEDEAARHPRHPEEIVQDFMHQAANLLGNHPKLQKLVDEIDAVTAPKE